MLDFIHSHPYSISLHLFFLSFPYFYLSPSSSSLSGSFFFPSIFKTQNLSQKFLVFFPFLISFAICFLNFILISYMYKWYLVPSFLLSSSFSSILSSCLLAVLPTEGPQIYLTRSKNKVGDVVTINCTSSKSKPAANLKWFINDHLIDPEHVCVLSSHLQSSSSLLPCYFILPSPPLSFFPLRFFLSQRWGGGRMEKTFSSSLTFRFVIHHDWLNFMEFFVFSSFSFFLVMTEGWWLWFDWILRKGFQRIGNIKFSNEVFSEGKTFREWNHEDEMYCYRGSNVSNEQGINRKHWTWSWWERGIWRKWKEKRQGWDS